MTELAVSVVVVSRDRPNELEKCLTALQFQRFQRFEVVVVADNAGCDAVANLAFANAVKLQQFDDANISAARNAGVRSSGGTVIAFIDDDAIAEPTWLSELVKPFEDPNVSAAGGFVRGRNGISLQWGAEAVGLTGDVEPLDVFGTTVQAGTAYRAIKTHGTNCAFRASILRDLGGFDEAYRFYLDETDLNMRLGQIGASTAIVPLAEVQHGFAASFFRGRDRAPKSLYQIGFSKGHFLKKFGNPREKFDAFLAAQEKRLVRHMITGGLEPRDVRRLRSELERGFEEGWGTHEATPQDLSSTTDQFRKFPTFTPQDRVLKGRWIGRRRLFERAKDLSEQGVTTTVFALSPTSIFHRRWFHSDGFWVQMGGKYGKSHRDDPYFQSYSLKTRVQREMIDLKTCRHTTL